MVERPALPGRVRLCIVGVAIVVGIALLLNGTGLQGAPLEAAGQPRFKAVAFDYFVLFKPDSVVSDADAVFRGRGCELTNLWRIRQFEYSWLRSITGRYVNFYAVTEDALVYATRTMQLTLTTEQKHRLLNSY